MSKPQPIPLKKGSRIHFIGICGVAMSAVATAFHEQGYIVTGSDAGFFPPVSTNLTKLGIPYYSGWHPEQMIQNGTPDLVVVGNAISSQNPELLYVQEQKIHFMSYPEAVGAYLTKPKSIVVSGTYGKTTSSALLSHIFLESGMKPSYMTGGVTQNNMPSAAIGDGDWSIVEGDEYSTAKWDKLAKFFHYKPTHLLLTAIKWDHADLYTTEESYFDAFRKLIDMIQPAPAGLIVACIDTKTLPALLREAKKKFVSYGKAPSENTANKKAEKPDYAYEKVTQNPEGITFSIVHAGQTYTVQSPLLGGYNAENITGCFAMAHQAGIPTDKIIASIVTFKGMKRRMEKRFEGTTGPNSGVTVIDDLAHSPEKARSVLENIRSIYTGLVVAVYEPNIGNRTHQSKADYTDAFLNADTVVIPRLSKLKVDPSNPDKMFEGQELALTIAESHKDVHYLEDDGDLVAFITLARMPGDVIVFLGSHGFRGMIEETVKKLSESI